MNVGKIGKRTSLLQVSPGGSCLPATSGLSIDASDELFVSGFFYVRPVSGEVPEVYPERSSKARGPPSSTTSSLTCRALSGRGPQVRVGAFVQVYFKRRG